MKPVIRPVRTLLAAAVALAGAPAFAQTYSQTIFFGDSLTDTGAFRPGLVRAGGPNAAILGRFTTNPDLIWADFLADFYGTDASPVTYAECGFGGCPPVDPQSVVEEGGSNYAIGGARNGTDGHTYLIPDYGVVVPSVLTQVQAYLASTGGAADPDALYTVWGGANDLFAITNGAPAEATLAGSVTAQITAIGMLQAAGAQYVIVPTVPDLGLTPAFIAQGQSATGTQLAVAYNTALFDNLAASGLRVIPLDTFTLLHEIAADPGLYGFTNITGTACQPQITAQSLTCNPATLVSPDAPDTYLYADGVHPTGRAHEILAQYAVSVLEAPRQVAVLPHSAAMVGRARAERVAAHVGGASTDGGMHWWADVRGDFQRNRMNGGDDDGLLYDGVGPTLTFGVDWTSGNLVYGAFAGHGRQDLDWGQRRGNFEQSDTTLGGFVGWYGEALWANAQASYSRLAFDVAREVQLGPATRTHRGSPDGSNLSAGFSGGWNLHHGALTHGPVLALLSQRIEVDGYAEDSDQSTALAYPDQEFDSLVGSLGWQASYAINDHLRPYARLTVDREFQDAPAQAFAQSQSIPGALPYAVPGLDYDDQYGTVVVGARTRLFGLDANLGASATVNQGGAGDASVFATFGSAF